MVGCAFIREWIAAGSDLYANNDPRLEDAAEGGRSGAASMLRVQHGRRFATVMDSLRAVLEGTTVLLGGPHCGLAAAHAQEERGASFGTPHNRAAVSPEPGGAGADGPGVGSCFGSTA